MTAGFFSVCAGSACVLAQLGMYIWLHEDIVVSAVVTPIIVFAAIPIVVIVWPGGAKENSYSAPDPSRGHYGTVANSQSQ